MHLLCIYLACATRQENWHIWCADCDPRIRAGCRITSLSQEATGETSPYKALFLKILFAHVCIFIRIWSASATTGWLHLHLLAKPDEARNWKSFHLAAHLCLCICVCVFVFVYLYLCIFGTGSLSISQPTCKWKNPVTESYDDNFFFERILLLTPHTFLTDFLAPSGALVVIMV